MEDDNFTHPLLKIGIYTGTVIVLTLFTIFGGCSMHSNTFDGERLKGQAEIQRAKTEASVAESNTRLEEIKAIERLINSGTNPIAARCAVKGWTGSDRNACLLAGSKINARN